MNICAILQHENPLILGAAQSWLGRLAPMSEVHNSGVV
jgi:hypothetical protein